MSLIKFTIPTFTSKEEEEEREREKFGSERSVSFGGAVQGHGVRDGGYDMIR